MIAQRIKEMKTVLVVIMAIWGAFFVDIFLPMHRFGVIPRDPLGLPGIGLSIFVHANLPHIIANSISLFIFGMIYALFKGKGTLTTVAIITIGSGLLTWLIGRNAIHMGASGLVFGLYTYLVAFGWYSKNMLAALVSIFLVFGYGSMMFGILPLNSFVSWEAHLSGAIVGILLAKYRANHGFFAPEQIASKVG